MVQLFLLLLVGPAASVSLRLQRPAFMHAASGVGTAVPSAAVGGAGSVVNEGFQQRESFSRFRVLGLIGLGFNALGTLSPKPKTFNPVLTAGSRAHLVLKCPRYLNYLNDMGSQHLLYIALKENCGVPSHSPHIPKISDGPPLLRKP